jgi:hypothetical protein
LLCQGNVAVAGTGAVAVAFTVIVASALSGAVAGIGAVAFAGSSRRPVVVAAAEGALFPPDGLALTLLRRFGGPFDRGDQNAG